MKLNGPSLKCPSWTIVSCSSSTSIRSFIDRNGKPIAVCSTSDQPVPIPSSIRPLETWSAVVTSFASTDGCRKEVGDTIVPSRSDVVRAASALIVPQASSAPRSPAPMTDR